MTSASKWGRSRHNLNKMELGEVRTYHNLSERERGLLRRAAHNLNLRSSLYFVTRYREGVMTITRVR